MLYQRPSPQRVLAQLQDATVQEDYEKIGDLLAVVYEKQWEKIKDIELAESKAYVQATTYFDKGELEKALTISTSIYQKAPLGWRFRYLRIRTLEKLGRQAFEQGNLNKAEEYAQQILHIMFRLEGTNLLADIYSRRIQDAVKVKNIKAAREYYLFIKDYEVSPDRKKILDAVGKKIL